MSDLTKHPRRDIDGNIIDDDGNVIQDRVKEAERAAAKKEEEKAGESKPEENFDDMKEYKVIVPFEDYVAGDVVSEEDVDQEEIARLVEAGSLEEIPL